MRRLLVFLLLLPSFVLAAKLPDTPQSGVFFGGAHHAVVFNDAGTAKIKFQHRDSSSFGSNLTLSVPAVADGDDLAVIPLTRNIPLGWVTFAGVALPEISRGYKNNNADTVAEWSTYDPGNSLINPSLADAADYIWAAWRDGSNNIQVARSTNIADYTAGTLTFGSPTTIKATAGTGAWPQLVHDKLHSSENLGALYAYLSTTNKLEYRPYTAATTTWGAVETVDTTLYSLTSFRGVTCRNGDIYVVFREDADDKLYYIVRSGGIWGTATLIDNDTLYNGDGYFTATANLGAEESVYVVYFDSTNLVKREITGSGVGGKTTVVATPTWANGNIQSPYDAVDEYLVAYEDSANAIQTAEITLSYTAAVSGSGLSVIGHAGGTYSMSGQNSRYMQSFNGKTVVMYTTYSGEGLVNVVDESTGLFDFAWTHMTNYPYFDPGHNALTLFIDNDGYVYIAEGGRYNEVDFKIYKSDFPLGHASFTLNKAADWTDISPPAVSKGRGYKAILVDQTNVIYLLIGVYQWNGGALNIRAEEYHITEYRTGAWSTPVKFVDYTGTMGSASDDNMYVTGFTLGEEPSGQKSLHVFFGMRENDWIVPDWHSLGLSDIQYVKIVPNGDGTFAFYDHNGNTKTAPLSYTNGDKVYDQWEPLYNTQENLTAYTEGDTTASITVTSSTVTHDSVYREETGAYVRKDFGAAYFSGKYQVRWEAKLTGVQATTNGLFASLMLTESPTDFYEIGTVSGEDGIGVGFQSVYNAGNTYERLIAYMSNGATKDAYICGTFGDDLVLGDYYYFTLDVDAVAETAVLTMRDTSHSGTINCQKSWTGIPVDNYRYLYTFSPYNTSTGAWTSGESRNYYIAKQGNNLNVVGNLGWADMIDASNPVLAVPMYEAGNGYGQKPGEATGYYFFKPDGTGWTKTAINTTEMPAQLGWNNSTRVARIGSGTFFSVSEVEQAGVKKIAHTKSSNSGSTWDIATVVPSSYNASDAFVARTSTTKGRVIYAAETSYLTSEVVTFTLQLQTGGIRMDGVQAVKIDGVTPVDIN